MINNIVSHYKILEELGKGGMGIIYKAEDLKLHRTVALKFLPPEFTCNEEAKERFLNEAHSASSLQHHNVCTIHDIDETDDGQMFICMDYYEGETLKSKISAGRLDIRETTDIVSQIAEGLKKAHQNGIVHRDIKPANIFITKDGIVKILDFGIAKLRGQSIATRTGIMLGTIAYMSPEQARGEEVDQRADIWSLGVLLYEMLSGEVPFKGEYDQVIIYSILNSEPEEFETDANPGAESLNSVIKKCMQKVPENRYQSIEELETDLIKLQREITLPEFFPSGRKKYFKKADIITAVIFVVAVLLTISIWINRTKTFMPLNNSDYIIVSEFKNLTGERNFDNSLSLAAKVSLRQSPFINILSNERIIEVLERMELPPNISLGDSVAIEIARRERIRVVIAGEIYRLGSQYILTGKIEDATRGITVRLIRKEASSIEDVLPKLDELCQDLRSSLGESLKEIGKYKIPIAKATTQSLEALELYSKADMLQAYGDYRKAAVLLQRTVDIDSQFTFAVSDLSYVYRKIGDDSLAVYYHQKILPLLSRITDRERLYILSLYYGPSFEFDIPKAFHSARQLVTLYPNDPFGQHLLGWLAMYAGDTKTSIEAGMRAIEIDSSFAGTVYNNIAYSLAFDCRQDEAMRYFRKSKKLRPNYSAIDAYIAQLFWQEGKYDSAESVLKSLLSVDDPMRRVLTYTQLISLYYFQGRLDEAKEISDDAVEYSHNEKLTGIESYFHYLRGEIAADLGNLKVYKKEMNNAAMLSQTPFLEIPLIGISYSQHGMTREAKNILAKLSSCKSYDPYFKKRKRHFLHLINGSILLSKKKYKKSFAEFSSVKQIQKADPYFLIAQKGIAECYARLGDSNAVYALNSLLDNKCKTIMGFIKATYNTVLWTRHLLPEIHLELGKILIRKHEYRTAKYHLEKCRLAWKNADAGFKQAKETSKLSAQVSSGDK